MRRRSTTRSRQSALRRSFLSSLSARRFPPIVPLNIPCTRSFRRQHEDQDSTGAHCGCPFHAWHTAHGPGVSRTDQRGRDRQHRAVLPGATVTAAGPALIRPQSTIAGADGTYRFPGTPGRRLHVDVRAGRVPEITRENIRVVINTTLTVDVQLTLATLQESITVSAQSPIVDTSTTTIGTNFTKELLTEIPNARDIWAAMAQAPGFQVTGYDVGGSHTGTQTGYVTYGVSQQNTTRIEGVNTSEGASANAGYFDFGSFEEFQLGGAGNMADQDVPGASLNITVKSGGNRFRGCGTATSRTIRRLATTSPMRSRPPFEKDENGFFTRAAGGLTRGNPITGNTTSTSTSAGRSEEPGLVLLLVSLERSVQDDHRPSRSRAVEIEQRLYGEGHVPVEPEQPADRLREQAGEAPGQTRPRPDDPALDCVLSVVAQLSVEVRVDQRRRAARCSSTCSRATGTTSSRCARRRRSGTFRLRILCRPAGSGHE